MRTNNHVSLAVNRFFKSDSAGGILLLLCTIIAMIIANSYVAEAYNHIIHSTIRVGYKEFSLSMSVLHWVNDGLMAIFFLVVGMEIKRELAIGELKSLKKAILPFAAAIGGMIVPAIIYALFNYREPTAAGWGIPMATDIAFALGILSLSARKAPRGIVIFLMAFAIIDDLGAIVVIAIFYTSQLSWSALVAGLIAIILLLVINRLKVTFLPAYLLLGIILWVCLLKSGIHATIAGVLLGMSLPVGKDIEEYRTSLLHRLEQALGPWSAFLIMPVFALANAGVAIDFNQLLELIASPVSLGIIFGLFVGKQVGIFGMSYVLIKLKVAKLPSQVTMKHLYGASVLGGIGFTMSLFITSLSFSEELALSTAKIGIIAASILAGIVGTIIFKLLEKSSEQLVQAQTMETEGHIC
ncbi:Na+/H+ antiporter NhaA [Aminipila butyrica]|uniref:Na(+)/H(+) antiporter NhaA n=1 Tax=Aminipila butyrica TaxID=433296 RepID=A0A858BW33_9FIRM|nr:Na+/H+ antiporter NhaA [Aminipila butyrica]QIB70281.1 Na+/H+ antiporter NhaA [Aminipila butyrica]